MAFTKVTDPADNITNQPNKPVISATSLKQLFDETGKDLKTYLNDVLTVELEKTTDGDSGADNIGATALVGGIATTVQGIVEEVNAKIVADVGELATHKTSSDHDGRYYTETELNNGQLDNRYYTETEIDSFAVKLTGNQTISDVKTFSSSPIVPTPTTPTQVSNKGYVDSVAASFTLGVVPDNSITDVKLSNTAGQIKDRVTTLDGEVVKKTGAQTIADVKTFSSSPIVPTPTTPTQVANKGYVDTQDAFRVAKSGDTITGELMLQQPTTEFQSTSTKLGRSIINYSNAVDGTLGTIAITLPSPMGEDFITLKIKGQVYQGTSDNASVFELLVSGYASTGGWFSSSAAIVGNAPFSKVRLGVNGSGNPIILIGDLATNWRYPRIWVTEATTAKVFTGWTISLITSEAGITVSGTPVLQRYATTTADILSTNYVNTTTDYTQVAEFVHIVKAGAKYRISGELLYTRLAGGNVSFSIYLPTGSGTIVGSGVGQNAGGSTIIMTFKAIGAVGLAGSELYDMLATTSPVAASFNATIQCATTGEISLAGKCTTAATTMTLLAGSSFILEELPV